MHYALDRYQYVALEVTNHNPNRSGIHVNIVAITKVGCDQSQTITALATACITNALCA